MRAATAISITASIDDTVSFSATRDDGRAEFHAYLMKAGAESLGSRFL